MAEYSVAEIDAELARRKSAVSQKTKSGAPEISPVESTLTGASVGGSFGLTRPVLAATGMATGLKPKESWKLAGEFIKEAEEQNPKSYMGGMLGSFAVPGGGFGAVAKTGKLLKTARPAFQTLAGTTLASGLQAAGQRLSEGEKSREESAADEILNAMATNVAAFGAGEAVKKVAGALWRGGKRVISSLHNVSPQSVETYAANRKAVKTILKEKVESFAPGMADDTALTMSTKSGEVEAELVKLARAHKSSIDMDPVVKEIETQLTNLKKIKATPATRSAYEQLGKTLNTIKSNTEKIVETPKLLKTDYGDMVVGIDKATQGGYSAEDVLNLKRAFQHAADAVYEGADSGPLQDAYAAIAEKTANTLKGSVSGTGSLLAKEAEMIKARNAIGLKTIPDAARMKNLLATMFSPDQLRKGTAENVRKFDKIFGTNLEEAGKLFRAAIDFGKEDIISGYGTGRALLAPVFGSSLAKGAGILGTIAQAPVLAKSEITALKALEKGMKGLAGQFPRIERAREAASR